MEAPEGRERKNLIGVSLPKQITVIPRTMSSAFTAVAATGVAGILSHHIGIAAYCKAHHKANEKPANGKHNETSCVTQVRMLEQVPADKSVLRPAWPAPVTAALEAGRGLIAGSLQTAPAFAPESPPCQVPQSPCKYHSSDVSRQSGQSSKIPDAAISPRLPSCQAPAPHGAQR